MAESCPSVVELEAYLDVGSEVGIGPHIRACPDCSKRLEGLRADANFLADFSREAAEFRAVHNTGGGAVEFPAPPAGYSIRSVIGRGGQAVVYEAVQESTQRRVALKVVRLGTRDAPRRLRRFDREIDLVSNLRHPLIVSVFDSGITAEGEPYLVMEYVEGVPIAHDPNASLRESLEQFQRVCDAIRHAHQHGVVHRDIKPSNILVDQHGMPRVLDFGLATTLESSESLALTKTGEFLGTPIYAAPEQLRSGAAVADVRTDVYALGMILYELLTGSHPFAPHSALADIVTGILEQDPKRPSSLSGQLDHEIDTIALKAIAKEPERRYPSVDALHTDISHYLAGEPIEAKRDSTWYMLRKAARRYRWAVTSGAGLLVMLIAFSIWMSILYQRASETSRQLSSALATRDLDRGLDLSRADNLFSAEPLLWGEYLQWVDDADQIASWSRGSLLQRRAHWGLWELYQRQPCFATVRLGRERMRELLVESPESIVATTPDGHLVRWDPTTGAQTEIFRPTGLDAPPERVLTRFDIDRAFTLDRGVARSWELQSGRLVNTWRLSDSGELVGHSNLAKLPTGIAVATGHPNGDIRVWDIDSGALLHTIPTNLTTSKNIVVEDNGQVWIGAVYEGTLVLHDLDTGVTRAARESVLYGRLALAPDGRAVHSWKVWSGVDERPIATLEETALARGRGWVFGASGALVVGKGNTTPIWRADTGDLLRVLASHDAMICAMGPDDRTLATAHADGTVRAWDVAPDAGWRTIPVSDTAHCVRFDASGDRIVIAGAGPADEPVLRVLDAALTGDAEHKLTQTLHERVVSSAAFCRKDQRLITGDHDGRLVKWQVDGGELRPLQRAELPAEINAVATSPSNDWVAVACDDGRVWLWRPSDGVLRSLAGHQSRLSSVAFSADGTRLVSGSSDATRMVWKLDSDAPPRPIGRHNGDVRSVSFLAGDRWIATAGDDQVVSLWNAQGGGAPRRLSGHRARVFALAASPDGKLLASGDAGGRILLWDVASGAQLAELSPHDDMVFSLDFSPTGDRLLSGAADRTVRLWDLRYYERHMAGSFQYQQGRHTQIAN